ncbi:MAG: hypothetical protein Q4G28_03305 [Neisseria sp.]|nr:hypothetical protein [Neisseria sp.]
MQQISAGFQTNPAKGRLKLKVSDGLLVYAEQLAIAARQQVADSTDSTTRRANAVAEANFFDYIFIPF